MYCLHLNRNEITQVKSIEELTLGSEVGQTLRHSKTASVRVRTVVRKRTDTEDGSYDR